MAKENYTPEEKKTLKKMFWNSRLVFSSFNMVKMEGNAFALTMEPALDELYKDKKEKAEAMRRHDGFFNTHAVLFSLIAGITYALERQKKETGAVDDTTIENIKVALMGPTAGIGDAFFFNCLRVIAAGIAIGLCSQANILGVLLFILIYGGSQLAGSWYLLKTGYKYGTTFIDTIFSSGLMQALTKAASIMGITMVGAMVASSVKVKLAWTITIGEASVVVLDILDSIIPGALLLLDNIYYEVITDLNHICPDMLKIMFKLQPYSKFCLISDSNFIAGLPTGTYIRYGRENYADEKGLILNSDGRICGSGSWVLRNIKQLVTKVGVPVEQAFYMASINPARYLGTDGETGSLQTGKRADMIFVNDDFVCERTFVGGKLVYDRNIDTPETIFNAEALKLKVN